MKRLFVIFGILVCTTVFSQTININWMVDGQQYGNTTTCEYSGDVILPTAPTKYGYTFAGWEPRGYIFLEYIESTGTQFQYIDTKTNCSSNLKIEIMYIYTSNNIIGNHVFGARTYDLAGEGFGVGTVNGVIVFDYNGRINSITAAPNVTYKVIKDKQDNYLEIDGNIIGVQNNTEHTFSHNYSNYLFTLNNGGRPSSAQPTRIFYAKIWENDILVRNFVPAKRISDNAIGMYDTVTGTFFGNAGTGTFIAGPVAN